MNQLLIVSNRLPVQLYEEKGKIKIKPSVGGLATGMKSVYQEKGGKWIGWPGIAENKLTEEKRESIVGALKEHDCIPVFIQEKEFVKYYDGFSNKTIWPLFHYFSQYTSYERTYFDAYTRVNKMFADVVMENLEGVDRIWIHDYHLLLLPEMIKKERPDIAIGFFLHIPFPSYELFRTMPWRIELLEGLLGADLLGFHTYDYERHFLSCIRRLLGYDIKINQITLSDRIVKADVFPMGIDYQKFHKAALSVSNKSLEEKTKTGQAIIQHKKSAPDRKLILCIDRLDYSKGISNRLEAFEYFLEIFPEYRDKVTLVLLVVPSRINVDQYQQLKSEIDELVGRINGKYSRINWTPVWYFYRSLPFENLIELYTNCEVALLTPLRDGMNLVAKEFIASRIDKTGVLILSEMAGAAKELGEAVLINPNNMVEITAGIKTALDMPVELQIAANDLMQERLKSYTVEKWASEFIQALVHTQEIKNQFMGKIMNQDIKLKILDQYGNSRNSILFLDYDGTLVDFNPDPKKAFPDNELYDILDKLAERKNTEVVLISGRDKDTFTTWFGCKNYSLIAEHGVWINRANEEWELAEQLNADWKEAVRPSINFYVDRTPGSFLEEKNYSLVWHYRKADPELGPIRAMELKDDLTSLIGNLNLEILEGNKVIEIKSSGINKGRAAMHLLEKNKHDFILCIGDDWTDEYLFEEVPDKAITIKVGLTNTAARYALGNFSEVRLLLNQIASV